MRYIWLHINSITDGYDGGMPLAHFLKNYFKQHPILGSRDRKILSAMAYCFYRCAKGLAEDKNRTIEETVQLCLGLCGSEVLNNDKLFPHKTEAASIDFDPENIFPYETAISLGIHRQEWLASMLVQPDLFIRVRKDKGKIVSLLNSQKIPFAFISDNCLALPNGAKIDAVLPEDSYVVQDASSQKTGSFFTPRKNELWYDCCSGAGGKSLLLKDLEPGVRLTISDKRESIIHNLKQRFRLYNHQLPVAHVTDVADKEVLRKALGSKQFDNIICDAPCSGSGTWSRTPEQLYFFDAGSLQQFPVLQRAIAVNVSEYLKPGGRLIYITCSIFKEENEEVVTSVVQETGLSLVTTQLINGTGIKADNMFVAVMQKKQ